MKYNPIIVSLAAILCGLFLAVNSAFTQGTAFIYQGRLASGANVANGNYDLTVALFNVASGPGQVGNTLTNSAVAVSNGLFTVELDFNANFPGGIPPAGERWLEISVRTNGPGAFTTLTPRQKITATPYAIYSGGAATANSANSVAAANISGLISLAQLPGAVVTNNASNVTLNGLFVGNGAGITNVNLPANSGGAISSGGGFALSSSPGAGLAPVSIAVADVNNDGKPDLMAADDIGNTISVLTNNGSGIFTLASSPGVGLTPISVSAGDLNGDGRIDLASANFGTNTLSLLTNNGTGGFVLASSLVVDGEPTSVAIMDLNGDGKKDLVCTGFTNSRLSVLTNSGGGNFVLASFPPVGEGPSWVTVADVNGDNKPDLITANNSTNTLSILTNRGGGNFTLSSTPVVGSQPYSVTAADINGDGKLDLISADTADNTLTVLTNDGSGGFVFALTLPVGVSPYSVTAADLNLDGKMDLICGSIFPSKLTVLINNGGNSFTVLPTSPVGEQPYSVTAADLNADGKPDIITANGGDNNLSILLNTPTFNGYFNGVVSATNLFGSVPSSSLTSIPAENLTGQVPYATLTQVPAASLLGDVPPSTLTVVPANSLVGDVPSATLTSVPAAALFGSVPSATLTAVPAANLLGVISPFLLTSVPAANLTGSVPGASLTSVPAANLTGSVPGASLTSVPAGSLTGTIADARLSANAALLNANQTYTGSNTIAASGSLSFGSQTRQMLNLWGTKYAIGVQGLTLYFRTDNADVNNGFIWYRGGVHNDNYANAGGGTEMMHLVAGGLYVNGALVVTSDRNAKENFSDIKPREVLAKVAALPITSWNYKQDSSSRHVGPMAQDFYAAFGVGPDDKHIATVDADGVALAAIQGLNQKLEEKEARIGALEERLEKLEQLLDGKGEIGR
jgi:hypothetical protein